MCFFKEKVVFYGPVDDSGGINAGHLFPGIVPSENMIPVKEEVLC